jgi:hypothetical protein
MASYLDWAVAGIAKAVADLNTKVSGAPSDMSDSYLEVTRLSSDLVTLSGFVGKIVKELFSTLINIAGHTTNMWRDIFLQHFCPALLPSATVFLRASKYLGPKLFEPRLIQMAQYKLEKQKAQNSDDSGQGCDQKTPCFTAKPGQEDVTSLNLLPLERLWTLRVRENHISQPPLRLKVMAKVRARRVSLPDLFTARISQVQPTIPVGGRLQLFWSNWEKQGSDQYIAQLLRGG